MKYLDDKINQVSDDIWIERTWSPCNEEQAENRFNRKPIHYVSSYDKFVTTWTAVEVIDMKNNNGVWEKE
jgi:hypothetical protein